MIQLLYYTLLIVGIFIIGFAMVLLKKGQEQNWLPFSFILGSSFITLVAFILSNCISKGTNSYARGVTLLLLLGAVGIFVWKRKKAVEYFKSAKCRDYLSLLVCYLAGILPLTIYIIWNAQYPFCDGYTYICTGDYLMQHGYNVMVDIQETVEHPWLSQMLIYQTYHFRIGAQMLLAFASSVFGAKLSLELFLPVCALSVLLCGMAAWLFIANIKAVSNRAYFYVVIYICFNIPIVQWCIMYGFLPQIMGSALFLAAVAMLLPINEWKNRAVEQIVETSVVTAAFALTYSEMLPFLVLVIISLLLSIVVRRKKESLVVIGNICATGVLTICLIITYVPGMIQAILSEMGAIVGWNQNKDIVTYLAYLFSLVPAEYNFNRGQVTIGTMLAEFLVLLLWVGTCIGLRKSENSVKKIFCICTIPYFIIFCYFLFFTENPFVGGRINTWSVYKLIQYYAILAIPFIAVFIYTWLEQKQRLLLCLAVVFIVANVVQGVQYTNLLAKSMKDYVGSETPMNEYYKLYEKYKVCDNTIRLVGLPDKHRQMVTYFLKDVSLISEWNEDDYFVMIPEVNENADFCLYYTKDDASAIAGLVQAENTIYFGTGFYSEEFDGKGRKWRWGQKEAECFPIACNSATATIEFDVFVAAETAEKQTIDIYTEEGILIKSINIVAGQIVHDAIEWEKDMGKLTIKYSGKEIMTEEGREIAFAISNYYMENR